MNAATRTEAEECMVDRRVRKGNDRAESEALLEKVIAAHSVHDNLVYALVYHGFATEKQAEWFATEVSS